MKLIYHSRSCPDEWSCLLSKLCQCCFYYWKKYWWAPWRVYSTELWLAMVSSFQSKLSRLLTELARSFYSQCPIAALAFILVTWRLKITKHALHVEQSHWTKFKRIDFLGAIFLSTSIVAFLLSIDLCSKAKDFSSLLPIVAVSMCVLLLTFFILVENFWAKEPIFPLGLLTSRDSVTCYGTLALMSGAQLTVSHIEPAR